MHFNDFFKKNTEIKTQPTQHMDLVLSWVPNLPLPDLHGLQEEGKVVFGHT